MRQVTDWQEWHGAYADPASDLSKRLQAVQALIREAVDHVPAGAVRILSMCAGQAHDVVGALGNHDRRSDVKGLLVELDEGNVSAARLALDEVGLTGLDTLAADAGVTTPYAAAAPADVLLACGVFGNISDGDVQRTVSALPMLCASGATVIWTRHRRPPDLTSSIRSWFVRAGFEELAFVSPGDQRFSVGAHRLVASAKPFVPAVPLFSFVP